MTANSNTLRRVNCVTFFLFFLPAVGGVPVFRYWVFGVERTDRTPNT